MTAVVEPKRWGLASPTPGWLRLALASTGLTAAAGFAAGVGFEDVLPPAPLALPVAGGLAIALFLALRFGRLDSRVRAALALAVVAALAAQLGIWRINDAADRAAHADALVRAMAGQRQIRGLVADDPIPRPRTTTLTLSDVNVRMGETWEPLPARVLVTVPQHPEHEYGEHLQLQGKLQPLSRSSAGEALARQDVRASMSYPRVSYLANPEANPVLSLLYRLRHRLGDTISSTLPEPEASTLSATILGLHSTIEKDQQQALVETGTVHLVVISGFKLSLLAAALQSLALLLLRRVTAARLPRLLAMAAVAGSIVAYTVLSGATPSSVRAALMALAVVLANLAGRSYDRLTALGLAGLLVLLFRPFDLWDGGFQLSCLSVAGIALLAEPISLAVRRGFARLQPPLPDVPAARQIVRSHPLNWLGFAVGEAAGASLAATLFDLPVLANSFHILSLISPAANLLGMPLLSPIMLFGGLGSLLGAFAGPAGTPFLWLAWAFTRLLEIVIEVADAVPHAAVAVAGMPWWLVLGYYALLLAAAIRSTRRRQEADVLTARIPRRIRWSAAAGAALAVLAAPLAMLRPPAALTVTFLAVPGEATFIQTPSGKKVLVNGGENGPALLKQLGGLMAPWDRTVDLVVLTTPRADRLNGLEDLARNYQVRQIVAPDVAHPSFTLEAVKKAASPLPIVTGQAIDLGSGGRLELVYSSDQPVKRSSSPDQQTMVWRLSANGSSILLAGRLPEERWGGLGPLPDAAIESAVRPPTNAIWIVPVGRSESAAEEDALRLADTGNLTIRFGRQPELQ